MKSKKITALLLASAMVFSLASCSIPGGKRDRDDDDERIERTEDEETEKTTEKTTEETTSEETTEETTTTTESETEATEAKREEFSGKVVDFDDMHFYVKGKKYTLGKSTLQEMIDDGVPFEESDLKKVDQKIKKNQRQLTGGFRIRLDKFWSALVYVMNVEDDEKTLAESVIYRISVPSLDQNYKNEANLTFDFPLNITMDELVKNAGEPAEGNKKHNDYDNYHTDTFSYKQKSKKFLGSKAFNFDFKNDVLNKVELDYIP
ncbi:MAG: hypothetical protein IKH06_07435 [Clostridiales bacterium]|nr:hypothetical protein [Clostridiales bacterium]